MEELKIKNRIRLLSLRGEKNGNIIRKLERRLRKISEQQP